MTKALSIAVTAAALAAAVIAVAADGTSGKARPGSAVARLTDQKGNFIGSVWFLPRPGGKLAVRAALSWLREGLHGFHAHGAGKSETQFTPAGPHLNPAAVVHGLHAGDMPALQAGKSGTTWLEFPTDRLTVDDVMDADCSGGRVHARP